MPEASTDKAGQQAIALLLSPQSLQDVKPDVAASEPEVTGEQAAKLEAADRAMAAMDSRNGAGFVEAINDLVRILTQKRT